MYAVIEDCSRQFTVKSGETVWIDFRDDSQPGQLVTFDTVLLANGGGESVIGLPKISGAKVEATVVDRIAKGPKIDIGRLRRRKNSRRHTGHRQKYTTVQITNITVPGLKIVTPPPAPAAPAPVPTPEKGSV